MTRFLKLNCLVLGQDRNNIFEVSLGRTQSLAALKVAIRRENKPAFDHVPADSLVLWKVSIRVDSNFKTNVESLTLVEEESLSSPVEEVQNIFLLRGDTFMLSYNRRLHLVSKRNRVLHLSLLTAFH